MVAAACKELAECKGAEGYMEQAYCDILPDEVVPCQCSTALE